MIRQRGADRFWQDIHQQARCGRRPLRVLFELTYKCNFRCRHCYVPGAWRGKKDLTTSRVLDIIRQLKAAGCFYLGFTGGEIFTRLDIYEILSFCRRQGMQVILYTNGSLIDRAVAGRIAAAGVNKVDITLPAMREEIFDSIAGVRGARRKVFAAIEHLSKKGVALGFKTCLVKENKDEIRAVRRFCAAGGWRHRFDDSTSPRIDQLARKRTATPSARGGPAAAPPRRGRSRRSSGTGARRARRGARSERRVSATGRGLSFSRARVECSSGREPLDAMRQTVYTPYTEIARP